MVYIHREGMKVRVHPILTFAIPPDTGFPGYLKKYGLIIGWVPDILCTFKTLKYKSTYFKGYWQPCQP